MALPDYLRVQDATAVVFADSATHAPAAANNFGTQSVQLDLTSLAFGTARQSTKADLGATRAELFSIYAAVKWATAPANTEDVSFFWAPSTSGTAASANVGNTTGADSAYAGYAANLTDSLRHLLRIGLMMATVDVVVQSGFIGVFSPPTRYGNLVVVNNSAADNLFGDAIEMSIAMIPVEGVQEDT